jgi:cytochrome c oxidase cbb3-type subunit IV
MDINDLIGTIVTVVFFITFLGIVWWAYGSSRKKRFEEDGKIPFEEIDDLPHEKNLGDKK